MAATSNSTDAILLEGSDSFEQKIAVEWQTAFAPDEFDGLLAPILADPCPLLECRRWK